MKNVFAFCVYFALSLFLNNPVSPYKQCELDVPKHGYATLGGGMTVREADLESYYYYVDNKQDITYDCYEGYRLEGEKHSTCWDGIWSTDVPKCMQIVCKNPPNIENASYESDELNQPFVENLFLHPKCSEGFRLKQGSRERIMCMRDGTRLRWTRSPICEVNPYCGDPGYPENGFRIGDSFYEGDEVTFICDDKFSRFGMDTLKCLDDGTWSSWTPSCEEIPYCGDPGTPISGYREGDSFFEGDRVSFGCGVEGDQLIGNEEITCGSNGQWSSTRPRCKPPSSCPDLPNLAHGLYSSPDRSRDYYIPGDEVIVSCQTGYKLKSSYDRLHCTDKRSKNVRRNKHAYDGRRFREDDDSEINQPYWKEDVLLECAEIRCDYPKIPDYGFIHELQDTHVETDQTFPYKFTLNYECSKSDYQLIGPHFSSCLETGWTPSISEVSCKQIRCPEVGAPDHGAYHYMSASRRNIGDVVKFTCASTYTLRGSPMRQCLENGQWSGDLAVCVGFSHCPDPGTPLGGYKIGMVYEKGSVVHFSCKPGSTLIGSKSRTCLDDGNWSGNEVFCKKYTDFDRPLEVQYRLLSNLDSTILLTDSMTAEKSPSESTEKRNLSIANKPPGFYGRALNLNYDKGNLVLYFIFDSSSSVGQKSFNLSVDFVKALVERVTVTADGVRVGGAAFSKSIHGDQGFTPVEYFTTADVLQALDRLKSNKFEGGGTNIYGALAYFETGVRPLLIQRLKEIKTHIILLTDGLYNTGGDPRALVKKMKERGVEFSCVGISGNKETKMDVINDIASKSTNVYILKDYNQMQWIVDQVLTGKVDYSRCGLSVSTVTVRVFNGNIITKTYWPWMAMLRGPSFKTRLEIGFCGGSLIDRQWILTAAHCLYYGNKTMRIRRKDKEIEVRLGYTKDHNHDYTQTISAQKIFKHEKFSFETFHHDVALIKLEQPVDYKKHVRPVCLSPPDQDIPENSPLYAEGSPGWAIGYGTFKDEPIDKSEEFRDLREVALNLGTRADCTRVLEEKIFAPPFTDQMFCAGGTEGFDTCEGDSGGPFMKQLFHDDGASYWTQTGIVSFSPYEKCGLKGVYGYYVKVSAVREWIDNIMRTN